ncbi:exonuclease, SbcC family protein [Listeria weihenstephanensis FSL R9-0317]|uniref:Nuclease SbcCD subunit C n=1 Tax=Listeria weihenstephanensis TaxID=1006155 RepID=A0A1S7FUG9_9LIST|nr:SMC family ATPase [Listeria weihenstephanensis]AQY51020.1 hypothetical protein UE46_08160 [Listeria weihenstephanensis]EUJ36436.1 exonuclease, SbcC family protein [Listeria weihenstephanensis FSL R9-0317]
MRPLRLTIQAFGAYAKAETIDFTELGQERIFVISGKTGAGKSTIFDAMTFALFGRANTNDREGFSLRSHYALPTDLTEVTLEFLLRGVRYQVRRVPQQEVAKQRGEGMTTVNAKAELYQLDGEEEQLLASSVRDVSAKIEEIMQLTVDQFRQILMIPQGEFRELLVAESKEKEAILQRLAHTHFYQLIENQLWNQQKEQEQKVRLLREKVSGITQEVFSEEELSGKTARDIELLFTERISVEKELSDKIQEQLAVAKEKAEITAKNVTLAEEKLAEWHQLAQLQTEKEKLEQQSEQVDLERRTIDLARKAGAIIDQDALCIRLKEQLDEAKIEQAAATKTLLHMESNLEKAVFEVDQLKAAENTFLEWGKKREQLQAMEAKVTRAQTLQQDLAQTQEKKRRLEGELEGLVSLEQKLVAKSEALAEQWQQAQKMQIRYAEVKQQLAELKQKEAVFLTEMNKWEQKQTLQKDLGKLDADFEVAKSVAILADEAYKQAEASWQHEQAAILALTLADGDSCPVCGSLEHPEPAIHSATITKLEVTESREKQVAANEAMKDLEAKRKQKSWQIEQIEFASDQSLDALKETLEVNANELLEVEQEQVVIEKFLAETSNVEEENQKNKLELIEVTKNRATSQEAFEEVRKQVDIAETTYRLLLEDVPAEFQDTAHFYEQQVLLTKQISAYEEKKKHADQALDIAKEQHYKAVSTLDATKKTAIKAEQALGEQRIIFKEIMAANGFADYPSYRQAILATEVLAEKENLVKDYEQRYHFVTERLKESEGRLSGSTRPDIESLAQQNKEAQNVYHEQAERSITQKEAIQKLARLSEQFLKYLEETSQAEKDYADIGYLADMARGKNDRRLTFERFVLATFLDTILLRANGRLKKMTSGRFQLIRKKEKSKGNVQSGLELEVYDEYTGLERHVKTLSGGESFKTSLALALALAEVVQEMSGGISLETMFIDEGFGTLDPESLEMAVECLLETQESGRLVGIISHVPELKERIPTRLEVTATNHGSTTKFFTQEQF